MNRGRMQVYWLEQKLSDVPGQDDWLGQRELSVLQRLQVPKRRSDWRLGRWTAKCAVAAYLGWPQSQLPRIEVLSASTGAPGVLLPDRVRGPSLSISHCGGVCMCAVAPANARIGCDLECVEPRNDYFLQTFFDDDECAAVAGVPDDQKALLANLIWSAKESCLKYIGEGLSRDTREAHVSTPDKLSVSPLLANPAHWISLVMTIDGIQIEGRGRMWGDFVETLAGTGWVPFPLATTIEPVGMRRLFIS